MLNVQKTIKVKNYVSYKNSLYVLAHCSAITHHTYYSEFMYELAQSFLHRKCKSHIKTISLFKTWKACWSNKSFLISLLPLHLCMSILVSQSRPLRMYMNYKDYLSHYLITFNLRSSPSHRFNSSLIHHLSLLFYQSKLLSFLEYNGAIVKFTRSFYQVTKLL